MISDHLLFEQLGKVIASTNYQGYGEKYEGKVRDTYSNGDKRLIVTTDRLSCFDRVITTIPFKGQVIHELALWWFEKSRHIIANHLLEQDTLSQENLSAPGPNCIWVKNCQVVPIEVVVRGYLAGSGLRDYQGGKTISGVTLPLGLKPYQRLDNPILTPTTKAAKGLHDQPISEEEIISSKIIDAKLWHEIREIALALYQLGNEVAKSNSLILADTKYEFGLCHGKLILIDELHTLDSSRYWIEDSYQKLFLSGESPEMLDKQPIRRSLMERGFSGDGPLPHISDSERVEIAKHYINSYERILGATFSMNSPILEHFAPLT
jgi:phosphoribosylaminoimidazole-succinocarboxamide synthase